MSGDQIPEPTYEYVATAKCGCIVGLIADIPGFEASTAKSVASFIKDGCIVERLDRSSQAFKEALHSFGHMCQPGQLSYISENTP